MELFSVGCLDLSYPNRKLSEAGKGLLRDISIPRSQTVSLAKNREQTQPSVAHSFEHVFHLDH